MRKKGKNSGFSFLLSVLVLLCGTACNVTKHLDPGQQLYTGASVEVESEEEENIKQVKKQLREVLMPEPNQTVIGIRPKLWFYYKGGEDPKKGLKKFMKYKLGERPVLFDPGIPGHVTDLLANRLQNMGYFENSVRYSIHTKNNKTTVTYTAAIVKPYTISEIFYPSDESELGYAVRSTRSESVIKVGSRYDLNLFKNERARIDQHMKEQGFYFFSPDHLLFRADTTLGSRSVRLRMVVKRDVPEKALIPYRIGEVYIYSSHRLNDTTSRKKRTADTVMVEGFHYIYRDSTFKPGAIAHAIVLRKGQLYSRRAHSSSLTRLMSMGMFHYVNIRFEDTLAGDSAVLNAHIYLTPMERRTVQLELQAVTKSNNYTGPALIMSYKNRNLFRGAELLILNLNSNYEMQFTGVQRGFNSYELGTSAQLFFPRFIVPFKLRNVSSRYIPKTKFEIGFRNLHRMQYFNMNAVNFSYGFAWRESLEKEHQFNPFAVNFAKVLSSTQAFQDVLRSNPFLRRTFEEQFTIGSNYGFTYNGLVNNPRSDQFYFHGMIDLSGNLLNLIHQTLYKRKPSIEEPFYLFNFRYAQYSKISTDLRHYRVFNKHSRLTSRIIAGIGVPYGNSQSLPYIKQFFSGGANSIRAFLPRTLGPGTFISQDSTGGRRGFLDQAGDVKLEGSMEYRFTIVGFLKGAVFVDAGNVWLFRENVQLPGGRFNVSTFYKELAVGTGFGLRVDITYFVLRFDLGTPLRKPYVRSNNGWVHRDIDFSSRSWRRQNLVLNIAIGYPF